MRVVLERCYNDLRLLNVSSKTLKAEGFFRSNKVHALVFKLFIHCICRLTCCAVKGMDICTELIMDNCHVFCCSVWGLCAQYGDADECSRLYMKPSVRKREGIENQTSGCYSSSNDAEVNSLMMKTVRSQAFLGNKDRYIAMKLAWMCFLTHLNNYTCSQY